MCRHALKITCRSVIDDSRMPGCRRMSMRYISALMWVAMISCCVLFEQTVCVFSSRSACVSFGRDDEWKVFTDVDLR